MASIADSPTARVTRMLDATPEEVFDAWTDPDRARRWMCPVGATVPDLTLEARVGERLRLVMRLDGKDFVHRGEFLEVDRPRRLVFTWITTYTHDKKSVVTVEFEPVDDRTEVRITHGLLPDEALADVHRKGWESLLDHLIRVLPIFLVSPRTSRLDISSGREIVTSGSTFSSPPKMSSPRVAGL